FMDMKIKGGGLKVWVKTRWGSLYFTTDSMLHARPVFDWLLSEHKESITKQEIANLIANEDFFTMCRLVHSVWQPIKEAIYALETNEATLADCFAYLIKLAIAIIRLPEINTFKIPAIHIFNRRYEEFLHLLYILAYFIHPQYRGKGLNNNGFHKAALTAIEIWQSLGHTRSESNELVALMRRFEAKLPPFDLPYVSALRIFSINPTQANCERNFSMLKWILGDRQTSLDINKLEGMSKIKSYYTANIRRELNFFGKELTEADLRDACNISSVGNIMDYNEDQTGANNETSLEDMFNDSTTLLIGEVFDLETEENSESFAVKTVQADSFDNLDYDPCDVLDNFLEREKQSS
ncbi:3983_t:CDS:2, partial [Gigaspora margarita]